ncbi:hypothetical protein [Paenibacillus sp. 8b26]|uniref:hypothetical protein n=1 Tax=Paenibacillus sp. 8b26 TaxID=3424133 RepID=UPI003D64A44F
MKDIKGACKRYDHYMMYGIPAFTDKEEIIAWLQQYPSLVPEDYGQKLERLKHMKNKRYKTVPGDIFRVEMDLFTDGYVRFVH